jgi:uncharacterized protein
VFFVSFVCFVVTAGIRSFGAEPALLTAVKRGDTAAVKTLLSRKADVNVGEADGTTALHWAAHRDDAAMVDLLIRSGASARAATRYGVTPLQLAATNGGAAVIDRLLAAGADPDTAMPDGETVLMTAARAGKVEAVRALLARGANVAAKEPSKGQTALMWAAAENNTAVVRALIEAGANLRERSKSGSFSPYLFAVRGGHVETALALIDAGADVNETMPDGTSALVLAVTNAHYQLAGALLDKGADANAAVQGWTALHQVAWSRRHNAGFNLPGPVATGTLDSLDLVRLLVRRGAQVNARLTKEPRDGNRNMLNRIGATPFLMAAKSADVPLMRVLLESGADASLTTDRGTTPLMVAAGVGIWAPGENPGTHDEALAAVKLALEAGGGRVTDIDKDGETALHGAVYRGGAIPVIQFLIDRGAVLDVRNKKGWIPLTAADGVEYTPAVLKRYPEAAALLRRAMRERGLPVPEPGQSGTSPASEASGTGRAGRAGRAGGASGVNAPGAAASARGALTPSGPPAQPAALVQKTIWDGVFTDAQATRGQGSYKEKCASCHKEDLLGESDAPALAGTQFASRWTGTTVDEMVQTIRRSMPQEAPDSLGVPIYVDIVSFLFKANGAPAGAAELSTERPQLQQIRITAR